MPGVEWVLSPGGLGAAGSGACLATVLSGVHLLSHFKNYHEPVRQRYTARVVLMVPIYAVDSLVSLLLSGAGPKGAQAAFVVTSLRDVYEAYCLCVPDFLNPRRGELPSDPSLLFLALHPPPYVLAFRLLPPPPTYTQAHSLSLWRGRDTKSDCSCIDCSTLFEHRYNFLQLCLCYVGGQAALVYLWQSENREIPSSWLFGTCLMKNVNLNHKFLRLVLLGSLQFVIVKIFLAAALVPLEFLDLYAEGEFRADRAYVYTTVLYNISISIALYSLMVFYKAAEPYLRPHKPLLKFAIVKALIFATFWQGLVVSVLFHVGTLQPLPGLESVSKSSIAVQAWLICVVRPSPLPPQKKPHPPTTQEPLFGAPALHYPAADLSAAGVWRSRVCQPRGLPALKKQATQDLGHSLPEAFSGAEGPHSGLQHDPQSGIRELVRPSVYPLPLAPCPTALPSSPGDPAYCILHTAYRSGSAC